MKDYFENLDKKNVVYILAAVCSLVFLIFDPSISFGVILGFVFCILNLKLVYKAMDDAFANKGGMKRFTKTSVYRFALLAIFVYLGVWYAPYFHLLGITIGMALGLAVSIIDRKKVS